ncbi:MAG: hypothetical protein JST28_09615 [Acidobacteria bacterium]|nr:hypothetical protein [Acidobacteriota bacterium]
MPHPIQEAGQKTTGSFASFLASFAGRQQSDSWDDSALASDAVTLTYEQALSAPRGARISGTAVDSGHRNKVHPSASPTSSSAPANTVAGKKHRSASITIRVTAEEQAQLHERAVNAGLSVSAYLRLCIFEAESLRSQVKEALTKMQSAQTDMAEEPRRRLKGLFPAWFRRTKPGADP